MDAEHIASDSSQRSKEHEKKAFIFSENPYIAGEGSEGNEKCVIFLETDGFATQWPSLAELCCRVVQKAESEVLCLDIKPRKLPSKMLKVQADFLLLLIKCKRKEING
jgi:hypothetical protein